MTTQSKSASEAAPIKKRDVLLEVKDLQTHFRGCFGPFTLVSLPV